ncbi:hypothetical protein TUZN_1820 [Thermoproteus uzoniensis 768-20]|uniref:DUF2070 domain-containing protein n=1 Tax=Thermoproteus uzoniensis (strain 768-20) TaxID=999630 RepID=F2L3W8_THEU7|nr:DUF2070 family protein [Thermoproteus uzoniensis]AEA13280.1 hypothetical protein TUZN_1820 [Thermoproteus uzoniensis 768-20]
MKRTFEEVYSNVFNEAPSILSYILFTVILITIIIKRNALYIISFLLFYLFFFFVGRRLWTRAGVFKVTSFALGLGALFDLILEKPPLHYLLISSVVASSMSMSLRCKDRVYLVPMVLTPLYYLYLHDYALATVAAAYAVSMPLLKRYLAGRIKGGDALCMLNSFLYSSVSAEGMFDHVFKPLGVRDRGKIHLYLIEGGRRHLIVVSDFHPGPFRNVGGGILVEKLVARGLRSGYDVVFIHGVGSHERDPVSSDDVEKIVGEIFRVASSMRAEDALRGVRPQRLEVGDVRLTTYSLGVGPPLAIISRVSSASDDVPLDVAQKVDAKGYVIVDAQNKFDGPLKWSDEDVSSLQKALDIVAKPESCREFKVGIGRADSSLVDPLRLELGAGGVAAVVAECDGQKSLLLIFDGNNMDGSFYRELQDRFGKAYALVEAITTDTHASTGMGVGGSGYRVVGSGIRREELFRLVNKAVAAAESSLGAKRVAYREVEVEADVFGPNFAKIRSVVESYKRLGVLMVAYLILAPLLFASLL